MSNEILAIIRESGNTNPDELASALHDAIQSIVKEVIKSERNKKRPKPKQPAEEKRPVGRPRKYPPKIVDPDKVVDPKYHRLRTIRTNPMKVKLTNVETGEETLYKSMYRLMKDTKRSYDYYRARDGCIADGVKIEILV